MNPSDQLSEEVLAWGQYVKGFTKSHAKEGANAGLFIANQINAKIKKNDRSGPAEKLILVFALEIGLIHWMDDCYENGLLTENELNLVESALSGRTASVPNEFSGCLTLRQMQCDLANNILDYQLFLDYSARTCNACRAEALYSNGKINFSYAEYIENGSYSTTTLHALACISSLWGLDLHDRLHTGDLRDSLRYLSYIQRLQNDLYSLEKDVLEGDRANAIFVLEQYFSRPAARKFVEDQLDGYLRLVQQSISLLLPDDPWRILIEIMLDSGDQYYLQSSHRFPMASSS